MSKTKFNASLRSFFRLACLVTSVLLVSGCAVLTASPFPTNDPALIVPEEITPIPGGVETQPEVTVTQSGESTAAETPVSTETYLPVISQPEIINVTTLPDPNLYTWTEELSGLDNPIFLSGAGDNSGRLFIAEQGGIIFIAKERQILSQPFLDISAIASGPHNTSGYTERGLLGLAFHPDYASNGLFYVHYTDLNGNTVLARYQVSSTNPDQADPSSAVIILTQEQPFANHNGGTITFGPDGLLYMGLGDGGSAGDPLKSGQNTQTLLGKILRLDVDRASPYAIPADNPFANGGGLPEIWALGLRNPWRFSFDRLSGDLYIADVGQNEWEEVNFLAAGSIGGTNFGWNFFEGSHAYEGEPPASLTLTRPVAEYPHSQGCSVSGGTVVRDPNLPEWQGVYLYGDFCTGRVWGLLKVGSETWRNAELFQTGRKISSFGEDDEGRVYLLDHAGGRIYRLAKK